MLFGKREWVFPASIDTPPAAVISAKNPLRSSQSQTTTANIDGSSAPAMTAIDDLIYIVYRNAAGELILVNTRYSPP